MACQSLSLWRNTYQRSGKTPYHQYQQHYYQKLYEAKKLGFQQLISPILNEASFTQKWLVGENCMVGCCL